MTYPFNNIYKLRNLIKRCRTYKPATLVNLSASGSSLRSIPLVSHCFKLNHLKYLLILTWAFLKNRAQAPLLAIVSHTQTMMNMGLMTIKPMSDSVKSIRRLKKCLYIIKVFHNYLITLLNSIIFF